ncbi:MAG: TolC family protein [Bacteroidales bacterium]|nr:TolC family protein [Bacteroidales bacterium]MDD2425875.1 TolC family protein [Bacteroidales bacterium]MDD3989663.1 TolC family protein [Bacteroidales bacterium]MDD4638602.1 TolC family protein [Bacteroidales bacterium]
MKKILLFSILVISALTVKKSSAQQIIKITFEEAIEMAETQSPNALMAKHSFRSSYWQYRTFLARYLPSLSFKGTGPDYSTTYEKVWNSQFDRWDYKASNALSNNAALSLTQNIGLTGGSISLSSDITLFNDFENDTRRFITSPVRISFTQPLFSYNDLKWQKKTEPLRYEMARKEYLSLMEDVHKQTVSIFFSLAQAQISYQIAQVNYANSDTLWRIAQGRYELGTIAEDELLQMQLSWLNAETSRKTSEMNLRNAEIRMRSFLGFNDQVRLELIIPYEIPDLQVSLDEVYQLAMKNNPEIISQELGLLSAQSNVAQAKANRGFKANLYASFGLGDQDPVFSLAYKDPRQQQSISVGFTIPILDWGLGKGKYKMAQSSLELTEVKTRQARQDFQQNLYLDVERFNLQANQVKIAAKSDTVAQKMFEVTKQRFLIGKIAVIDLNNADTKKDQNRTQYIKSIQDYWTYFYNLRGLTLFDFITRKPLETDYDKLVE